MLGGLFFLIVAIVGIVTIGGDSSSSFFSFLVNNVGRVGVGKTNKRKKIEK